MKKPRSDSKLKTLSPEQQAKVWEWCQADGYSSARQRCKAELGVETSEASLCDFFSWYGLQQAFTAATQEASAAEELMREFDPADAQKAREFGQFIFTQRAIAAQDSKQFYLMESLRLDKETAAAKAQLEARKLDLAERRVVLLEEKQQAAKEKLNEVVSKGGLSPETLAQIEEAARLL